MRGHLTTLLLLALAFSSSAAQQITLPNGALVTGTLTTNAAGDLVHVFRGIPYAEPPVGERRWKQTTLKPLDANLTATSFGAICYGDGRVDPQSSIYLASEDCLFLNVYTPASATPLSKLPVMVWIHGGGFTAGASNIYDGSNLLTETNAVVVVTFNYRLSVFGLLAGDVLTSEGSGVNYALRDQEVAFQWVKQFIALFGGDAHSITAFGESAGAKSVYAHMVSRGGSQQLFHRAILQSGTYTTAHDVPTKTQQSAVFTQIATAVGCDANGEDAVVLSCLRTANTSAVWAAGGLLNWQPVVDGVLLLDAPLPSLLAGKISPIPTIIGTNTDEGWTFAAPFVKTDEAVLPFVRSRFALLTEPELVLLEALYPADHFQTATHRAAEMYGDAVYVCPSELTSLTLAELGGPTFRYRFNQTSTTFGYPLAVHTTEIRYVFNMAAGLAPDAATRAFVAEVQRFWTSFAATGSPTGARPGASAPPSTCSANTSAASALLEWPPYDPSTRQQIVLQSTGPTLEVTGECNALHEARCAFWSSVEQRLARSLQEV